MTTYKALERLSQSEFNLDRLEVTLSTSVTSTGENNNCKETASRLTVPGANPVPKPSPTNNANAATVLKVVKQTNKNLPLTIRDVERERGKPLSKYERNMMIFNWLHTLDDSAFVEGVQ